MTERPLNIASYDPAAPESAMARFVQQKVQEAFVRVVGRQLAGETPDGNMVYEELMK